MNTISKLPITKDETPPTNYGLDSILQAIGQLASNPNADPEKAERFMAMYERLLSKHAEKEFNSAMTECQDKLAPVAKDANNPSTKSKYASYIALDAAIRPIYTKHGFSVSFDTGDAPNENTVRVVSYVAHSAGHKRTYHLDLAADGKGAKGGDVMTKTHAIGSAVKYGRRYLLEMIFNIATGEKEDDGNAANGGVITPEQKDELIALIKETNTETAKVLTWAKVESIDELPAKKFKDAKELLETKKKAAK